MERKVKLFLLAAIVVYFGYAQTGISPTSQVKPCPVAATPMFVLSVAGLAAAGQPSVICAGLDPRAFSIDLTTTPPEIHLITVPNFVYGETPGGAVDGKNGAFTLANVPSPPASLHLWRNGLLQSAGGDYTLTAFTANFSGASTPQPGDTLLADYAH